MQHGVIIYHLLSTIRIYLTSPPNQNTTLNRTSAVRFIIGRCNFERIRIIKNHLNNSHETNFFGANSSLADSVDAIKHCLDANLSSKTPNSLRSLPDQISLSSLYEAYSKLWNGIMYQQLEFQINSAKHILEFREKADDLKLACVRAQTRRLRRSLNDYISLRNANNYKDVYLDICLNGRKRKIFKSKNNTDLDNYNLSLISQYVSFLETYPETLLKETNTKGFCIYEVIEIYRNISILSFSIQKQLSERKDSDNCEFYAPILNKTQIAKSLQSITKYPYYKINNILDFLTYEAYGKKDLWSHPIISLAEERIVLLSTPLIDGVLNRIVEKWLELLGKTQAEKGILFQFTIGNKVRSSLEKSQFREDSSVEFCQKIKLNKEEEEIDIIIKVGKLILIGEVKSRVTTDSYVSQYWALNTLDKASGQATRKSKFVEKNLKAFFKRFNWIYSETIGYEVHPIVITDNHAELGSKLFGVPIVDFHILTDFFSQNYFTLYAEDENPIIKLILYSTKEEAYDNLMKYLSTPPQMNSIGSFVETKETEITYLTNPIYKIKFFAIVSKHIPNPLEQITKIDYDFPIEIVK
ncbi:hypothetical protein [Legionella feeleii]|uniref:NERD domain-containing protein n=1 Tax=Legionella feeleii TaxID=453 RepID=A0A378IXH5_9GAMM|nr:hypothetical protein [Legionella feeleii]STX39612.1 Uncharacterised protein [Legionella feeleii]